MIFLHGYMETHRGVSYEAVHQGTLYAQHTGQIFIYIISDSSFKNIAQMLLMVKMCSSGEWPG